MILLIYNTPVSGASTICVNYLTCEYSSVEYVVVWDKDRTASNVQTSKEKACTQ